MALSANTEPHFTTIACFISTLNQEIIRLFLEVLFQGRSERKPEMFTQKMKRKIDSIKGRLIYNRRLRTAEPVFGNICSLGGLDRFALRGEKRVNTQWLLSCVVHNLLKVHRFGPEFV